MRVLLYEDNTYETLTPLALMRPVFELLCGRSCLRHRIQTELPGVDLGVRIRPWLAEVYAEEQPNVRVNDADWERSGPLLLINGRWIPDGRLKEDLFAANTVGIVDGSVAWLVLSSNKARHWNSDWSNPEDIAASCSPVSADGALINHPWDLINRNADQLQRDFSAAGVSQIPQCEHVQCQGDPTDIYVSRLAAIDPYVVIDARNGPISIGPHAHVQSFTHIEGPCHIASKTQIFRAQIRAGTTIGPVCRVGGEVEESILHGFVNKYHDGFLGHSYVCPWVNIGAATTTSDLKNDYSPVKVPLLGTPIETGSNKAGTYFGDHTKTAIGSMFNTGSAVGILCSVVPGGRLLPRHIPSFCSVLFGNLRPAGPLDRAIETARIAMQRREKNLTPAMEVLLRMVHEMTAGARRDAVARFERIGT